MPLKKQENCPAELSQRTARTEYTRRMNRVLDYIDHHLDTSLDLAQLADVANFSPFHFHRLFAAWMGETLGDYIRRRRLERAAHRLSCRAGASVLETALATGFGSGEAFARAFKLKFDCTPSGWRDGIGQRRVEQLAAMRGRNIGRHSNLDQANSKGDQDVATAFDDHELSHPPFRENNMDVKVIDLPKARVAYHRRIGAYGTGVTAFWRDTVAPWMQAHDLNEQLCYGVGHDDPSMTSPDKCRYDACVAVPDTFQAGGQANVCTLPGGRYAVAQFNGDPAAIDLAWMTFMREWLPSSGLQCDERPCFERFTASSALDPVTGKFACELCIPVRPL